jgi:uncharacterized membrane-anchored protein
MCNRLLLALFLVVAAAQLFVPAKMIWDKEQVFHQGKPFKFKAEPIDPYDPLRGKYITLSFERQRIKISQDDNWRHYQDVYAVLSEDSNGYARVTSILNSAPEYTQDYVLAKIDYVSAGKPRFAYIDFPFTRFYMEESKAQEAEWIYREATRDTTSVTYALVHIQNGDYALKDVYIDSVSISKLVLRGREEVQEE